MGVDTKNSKIGGDNDARSREVHVNPYLGGTDAVFIDERLAAAAARNAIREIADLSETATNAVDVLLERARRTVNRANLINEVALGEFMPDLKHATYVGEVIANRRFDLLNFDLRTLFPGASEQQIREYLARFRVSRERHPLLPTLSFPMALGVWGDPRELDEWQCSSHSNFADIKEREKDLPLKKKYFLSKWGGDFDTLFSLSFNPLVALPVLEDPDSYTLGDAEELQDLDGAFARRLMELYQGQLVRLNLTGINFQAPVIKRVLVVLPASRRPDSYSFEFLPEIQFPESFRSPPARYPNPLPIAAYDPYALVGGEMNKCGNYLKDESWHSDRRITLEGDDGKEALFSIESFAAMNMRERVEAAVRGTKEGEYMGNRVGFVLLPGRIHHVPPPPKPSHYSEGNLSHMFAMRGEATRGFGGGSSFSAPMVSEASVTTGTSGYWSAEKRAGMDKRFAYEQGGQPVIVTVRYLTVVR